MRTFGVLFLVLFATSASGSACHAADDTSPIGGKIDGFRLPDYRGAPHALADAKEQKLIVVAFLATECPLSQQYAARLVELAGEFGPKGVAFFGIVSGARVARGRRALRAGAQDRLSRAQRPPRGGGRCVSCQADAGSLRAGRRADRSLLGPDRRPIRHRLQAAEAHAARPGGRLGGAVGGQGSEPAGGRVGRLLHRTHSQAAAQGPDHLCHGRGPDLAKAMRGLPPERRYRAFLSGEL